MNVANGIDTKKLVLLDDAEVSIIRHVTGNHDLNRIDLVDFYSKFIDSDKDGRISVAEDGQLQSIVDKLLDHTIEISDISKTDPLSA